MADSTICDTLGLYARTASDLQLLLDVFRLEDDEPPQPMNGLKGCKIGFTRTHVWPKASPALHKVWDDAKAALANAGAEVEEVELPKVFENMGEWHRRILQTEGRASFLGDYLANGKQLDPWILTHVNNDSKVTRKEQLESYDEIAKLRPVVDEIAGQYTCLVTPSVTDIAPVMEEPLRFTGDAVRVPLSVPRSEADFAIVFQSDVDSPASACGECARLCRRTRSANRSICRVAEVYRPSPARGREADWAGIRKGSYVAWSNEEEPRGKPKQPSQATAV